MKPHQFADEFLNRYREEVKYRLFTESIPRIEKCLHQLTTEEIWNRPNDQLVSIGNLVIHLCGNVTQYVLFGLGNQSDLRKRQSEFDQQDPIPADELIKKLHHLRDEVTKVLDDLQPSTLLETKNVQGYDLTGLGILMHVVEHFSYHVGQITWYTKLLKNIDLQYYAGKDLNITG